MIDITPFVVFAFVAFFFVAIYIVIPLIRANVDDTQFNEMLKWADVAVSVAQQLYYHLDGPTRKQHALKIMHDAGYDVSTDEVDAVIEAAVLKLHSALENRGAE